MRVINNDTIFPSIVKHELWFYSEILNFSTNYRMFVIICNCFRPIISGMLCFIKE